MRTIPKLIVVLGALLMAGAAQSDTVNVDVRSTRYQTTTAGNPGFGTRETSVHVGDSVLWTWNGGFHSVVADSGAFQSMLSGTIGFTYSVTFNTLGDVRYYCSLHGAPNGVGMSGIVHVQTKVSGTLQLEGCASAAVPLSVILHPADNSGDIARTVTPAANGDFTIPYLPAKDYTLLVKGSKWLAVSGAANTSGGNVSGLSLGTLRGGDADNSNLVDVEDLSLLIQAFDASPADANWNQGKADFNCNDIVDVEDLDIFIRNFDESGA
jgi:plastocyanin